MASPAAKPRPPPASLAGPPGSAAGCGGEAGPARGGPREPHVRAHRRGTGQPRKPSVATRWTEPGGGRSTPCAEEGCSAGAAPPPSLPSHVSGAESPTQRPREGAREAWPREAPGAEQRQPWTVWLQASPAPLWALGKSALALERGQQNGSQFCLGRGG